MRRCQSCTKNQYPNFVLVYIIDEDSDWNWQELDFLAVAGGVAADDYRASPFFYEEDYIGENFQFFAPAGGVREIAKYIDDLGFDSGSFGGFLGIVLVPVVRTDDGNNATIAHMRMKYRMNVFRDTLSEEHRENVIILGEESDPSGVAVIDREDDYSERLITAIETLRQSDDQEELVDLHYIINMIDGSGSHRPRDFEPSWANYFTYYTPPIWDGTNPAVDLFNSLTADDDDYGDGGSIFQSLIKSFDGSNWKTGLASGIGTRHVVFDEGETWPRSMSQLLFYLAAHQNNNWIENCRKLCRYRWTTDVGYWYALLRDGFVNQPSDQGWGLDWEQIDPSTNGDNLDVYGIVYNNRENSDNPEDEDFDLKMRSNFPDPRGWGTYRAHWYQTVGSTAGGYHGDYDLFGFEESPFKDAIFNSNRFHSNCPCYMFDPVRNYFIENLRDIRE